MCHQLPQGFFQLLLCDGIAPQKTVDILLIKWILENIVVQNGTNDVLGEGSQAKGRDGIIHKLKLDSNKKSHLRNYDGLAIKSTEWEINEDEAFTINIKSKYLASI
jgi:hypothetical protein